MVFVKPSANLRGRGIVLVDDVLTTGRSLRAAGMLLERLGPALLLAAVLAVTDHR
jgi:predicted amidophosphoribosyltransferase